MSFILTLGAGAYNFSALDIEHAVLETTNQGKDSLKLTLGVDMATASPFAPFEKVTLIDEAGTQRFIGWVDQPGAEAEGDRQQGEITISGPWIWLDRTPYSQPFVDTSTTPATISTTPVQVPMVNQSVDTTGLLTKLSIGDVIGAALACVTAMYGSVIGVSSGDLSGLTLQLPASEKQNVSVGSVVRDQLAWLPDHSLWWDYSGGSPTLHISSPGGEVAQVSESGTNATKIRITPRFDLLVSRVVITYVSSITDTDSNLVVRSTTVDDSAATGSGMASSTDASRLGCPTQLALTYPLQKEETVPTIGLATAYATALSKLQCEAQFNFYNEGLAWSYTPGQTWGFAGIASQWSAYTSTAQTITRDLFTHIVDVRLGHASHLGLQNIIDLHKKNTPQAALRGGAGGNAYAPSTVTVYVAIAWGTSTDYADAVTDCFVTLIGPAGPQTVAAPVSGAGILFGNLPPGTYTVLVTLSTSDWVMSSDTTQFSVAAGTNNTATVTLTRADSLSLIDVSGASVILDAVDGISINNGSDDTEDPGGQSSLDGSQLTIFDTTYSSVLDSNSLTLNGEGGQTVTIDLPPGTASASWQQVSVCIGGVTKTMYVLGTQPA